MTPLFSLSIRVINRAPCQVFLFERWAYPCLWGSLFKCWVDLGRVFQLEVIDQASKKEMRTYFCWWFFSQ